jgi:hypothetical protein
MACSTETRLTLQHARGAALRELHHEGRVHCSRRDTARSQLVPGGLLLLQMNNT